MGCFESYMEFREEVDKIKKERKNKMAPQPTKDVSGQNCPNFNFISV